MKKEKGENHAETLLVFSFLVVYINPFVGCLAVQFNSLILH